MTILSALHSSRIRNRSMGALHLIAADESCEVSDILALLSQPPQSSQAPVARMSDPAPADMQAEELPHGFSATPTPEPQPTSTPAVQAQDSMGLTQPIDVHSTSLPGAEGAVDLAPIAGDAQFRDPNDWEDEDGAQPTPSPLPGDPADGEGSPPNPAPTPSAAFAPAKKPTRRDTLRALLAEHPDWTAKELAFAMGIGEDNVRSIASQIGLKLPKAATKAERAKAATTEALKASPAKPQEPVERAGPPTPRTEPKQPPATTAAEPFDDDEPAPRVRKVTQAPTGRFYLRDKVTGHYAHQSLGPCPTGPGPMMTSDRKWAWYDTMERYRGAKKLWPELASMRKQGAQP